MYASGEAIRLSTGRGGFDSRHPCRNECSEDYTTQGHNPAALQGQILPHDSARVVTIGIEKGGTVFYNLVVVNVAEWSSLVAREPHKLEVVGSNPSSASMSGP